MFFFIFCLNYERICLHNCCQDLNKRLTREPIAYIEESVLWNCAAYSYKLDPALIPEKFTKFASEGTGGDFDKTVYF